MTALRRIADVGRHLEHRGSRARGRGSRLRLGRASRACAPRPRHPAAPSPPRASRARYRGPGRCRRRSRSCRRAAWSPGDSRGSGMEQAQSLAHVTRLGAPQERACSTLRKVAAARSLATRAQARMNIELTFGTTIANALRYLALDESCPRIVPLRRRRQAQFLHRRTHDDKEAAHLHHRDRGGFHRSLDPDAGGGRRLVVPRSHTSTPVALPRSIRAPSAARSHSRWAAWPSSATSCAGAKPTSFSASRRRKRPAEACAACSSPPSYPPPSAPGFSHLPLADIRR